MKKHPRDLLRFYFADIVYGATDGIVTTFSVVSGVEGASLSPSIAIILGIVNLLADGVSMGAASFLSIRSGEIANKLTSQYKQPLKHAAATFFSFVLFGAVPLISFLIPKFEEHRFILSCIMTGMALFIVGKLRSLIAKEPLLQGALEMLVIGGITAIISYFIGYFLSHYIH